MPVAVQSQVANRQTLLFPSLVLRGAAQRIRTSSSRSRRLGNIVVRAQVKTR